MSKKQKREKILEVKPTAPPLKKKRIKRKPGSTSKYYFDDATQESIVAYQREPDINKKNYIYIQQILPAFDQLVQNLINVYGFNVLYETKTDLKNECMEFLYGVLGKFNPDRGSRAFAYFNVVAKHWLTIKSKQNAKNIQSYVSLDNREALSRHDLTIIDDHNYFPSVEESLTEIDLTKDLKKLLCSIREKAKTESELQVLQAIDLLVKDLDKVDIISKRAIMLYIREITNLSSKQLSMILSNLKKHYKTAKEEVNL